MARGAGKNGWALFLLILAGVVLGSFISQLTSGVAPVRTYRLHIHPILSE